MTGPEFALSILASMIAAVILDILRNPAPPVPKEKSNNLLHSNKLIQKFASRILPYKKEEDARPTDKSEDGAIWGRNGFLKKSAGARAWTHHNVLRGSLKKIYMHYACAFFRFNPLRMLLPDPTNSSQGAFLKTLMS